MPPALSPNPSSPPPASTNRRLWLLVGLVGSIIAALVITYIGKAVVPKFQPVYDNFGADLPTATALFIRLYGLIWLLPALICCLWWFWRRGNGPILVGLLGLISPFVAFALALLLLYLPVLQLAAV